MEMCLCIIMGQHGTQVSILKVWFPFLKAVQKLHVLSRQFYFISGQLFIDFSCLIIDYYFLSTFESDLIDLF